MTPTIVATVVRIPEHKSGQHRVIIRQDLLATGGETLPANAGPMLKALAKGAETSVSVGWDGVPEGIAVGWTGVVRLSQSEAYMTQPRKDATAEQIAAFRSQPRNGGWSAEFFVD
jgi:hypothetical protein